MKRPRRNLRGMLPVFRDVHPDRCPVEFYCEDGSVGIRADLPEPMVLALEKLARKQRVTFQTVGCRAVIDAMERQQWGKLE